MSDATIDRSRRPGTRDLPAEAFALGVTVLRWPDDAAQLKTLPPGLPRLLLVPPGAMPPDDDDCAQDWIRLPADEYDVAARLRALSARARRHRRPPEVDAHGRLLHRGRWVALSPTEEALARPLVERYGSVVPYSDLVRAAWPDSQPTGNALRVHLFRLRRRALPLRLAIRSVRGCGVVLEEKAGDGTASS